MTWRSFLILAAVLLPAQPPAKPDPWAPLRWLSGSWSGTSKGKSGEGNSTRSYEFVLGGRFLHARNRSVYPPQAANPKGEIHEDWGMIGLDAARKKFVFRQFHVEGFVSQYVLEDAAAEPLVFTTEAIENIPAGWKARETMRAVSPDEFVEVFELAQPGKPFEIYSEQRFRRERGK